MSFLKEKEQLKKGLRVADTKEGTNLKGAYERGFVDGEQFACRPDGPANGPVEAVAPAPEYDFIIVLTGGQLSREDPENVYTHQDHIRVEGPGKNEWTKYPMTSIAYYGLQERGSKIQSSKGERT